MGVDVAALTQRGMRTAARAGLLSRATITRPAPPPNAVTGVKTGIETSFALDVDVLKLPKVARRNQAFTACSVAVYAAAADCPVPPLVGYTVQVGGKTYRVAAIDTDLVNGVTVGYVIGGAA
jgi:hypothetical protein